MTSNNKELEHKLLHSITGKQWEKIGVRPHHGICLPLFSLHSANSSGIGEFLDLCPLIAWCKQLKIDFIQLLPLNNVNSESDPSPYNAISSCALNFLYLSLHALPHLKELPELENRLHEFKKFNLCERIAYSEVFSHKKSWLKEYFAAVGKKVLESEEFKQFHSDHAWLQPYALFKTIKDGLDNTAWKTWPEDLRYPTPKRLEHLYKLYAEEIPFYLLLQYLCFTQLKEVKAYAEQQGIFLMGDIPILLSVESADVWQNLELFDTYLAAGAPPDIYNTEGQNWGFPIFNWEAMRKNHFEWWKQRLRYAENFFDLVRLDHIIGFFRIWAISPHSPSEEGHYIPATEQEWAQQGRELLSLFATSTSMLPIGEDLGIVPEIVRPCLEEFGICGTKVMRWEKDWEGDEDYIPIQDYPPISITYTSTHDSETLALWWKTYRKEAKAYAKHKHWHCTEELTLEQREEILWDSHHSSSLFHGNLLQEYLAFFPELSWPDPENERINIPGTVLPTNWTYRFRPSVEELTSHKDLFLKMSQIIFSTSTPSTQ